MTKTYYKLAYGGTASIQEHKDGSATVVMFAGYKRTTKKYSNIVSAKRAMSRACDGFYSVAN